MTDSKPEPEELCQCPCAPPINKMGFLPIEPPNMVVTPLEIRDEPKAPIPLEDFQSLAIQHVENKHRFRNFDRYMNIQRRQCEDNVAMKKAIEDTVVREKRGETANKLARELEILKREDFKEAKLRQQLRINSHELLDLERKLKAAYINKELAAQIAQNEAIKMNEKIHEQLAYDQMQKAWVDQKEFTKQQKLADMHKKAAYRKDLQEQLILREKSKRYLYEEYLREKKLIDDIVQRIYDEDERERIERMCRIKRTKQEIEAVKTAQAEWKKKRSDEIEEENRKIEDYLLQKSSGAQERLKAQNEKDARREMVIEKIATKLVEERESVKERNDLVQELMEEELRAKVEKRHRDDKEKQFRLRLENKITLNNQMKDHQDRIQQQKDEDRRYKEELIARMEEDAKLEQLSNQKKRMKQLQMRRDVEQLLAERRSKQAEEYQLMIGIEEDEKRNAEIRKKLIEEERIALLQEHVKNLVGYLPKGLLRPEDLPHLSAELKEQFHGNSCPCYIAPVHRKR